MARLKLTVRGFRKIFMVCCSETATRVVPIKTPLWDIMWVVVMGWPVIYVQNNIHRCKQSPKMSLVTDLRQILFVSQLKLPFLITMRRLVHPNCILSLNRGGIYIGAVELVQLSNVNVGGWKLPEECRFSSTVFYHGTWTYWGNHINMADVSHWFGGVEMPNVLLY